MGKYLGLIYVAAATLLPLAARAAFNTGLNETAGEAGYAITQKNTIIDSVAYIIHSLLTLLGVIFVLLVIYAGFRWMTAQGNQERVSEARKIIIDASIGIAITLSAYVITDFVISKVVAPATGTQ